MGIMEKKMEATMYELGFRVEGLRFIGFRVQGLGS